MVYTGFGRVGRPWLIAIALLSLLTVECHAQEWAYTVKAGDTLWDLSERLLVKRNYWRQLQALNGVSDPRRLPPGKKLRIRTEWLLMEQSSARLESVRGETVVIGANGAERPARDGLLLGPEDAVKTGPGATVRVVFSDGASVLVEGDSLMELIELRAFAPAGIANSIVELKGGGVEASLPPAKRSSGSRFRIRTRAATLAVRGTDFRARTGSDESTLIAETLTGRVAATAANVTRTIPANFGIKFIEGRRPERPRRLLPAPETADLPAVVERLPVSFDVALADSVAAYRAQYATDVSFSSFLFDGTSATGRVPGPSDLPDGDYVVRIRAIDPTGIEGGNAVHRFTLNARPEAPIALAPSDQGVARQATPQFQWGDSELAGSYKFQLAGTADFTAPLIDVQDIDGNSYTPSEPIAAGDYFWRIATVLPSGESGPFGLPLALTVRPAPASPEIELPEVGAEGTVLRWPAGAPGQTYEFQLARDYWFEDLIVNEVLTQPEVSIPPLPSNRYYLRLRVIDADGYTPEFGPRQAFVVPLGQAWQAIIVPALFLLLL